MAFFFQQNLFNKIKKEFDYQKIKGGSVRIYKVIKMLKMSFYDSVFSYDMKDVMSLDLVQIQISSPRNIFKSRYEMVEYAFQK